MLITQYINASKPNGSTLSIKYRLLYFRFKPLCNLSMLEKEQLPCIALLPLENFKHVFNIVNWP